MQERKLKLYVALFCYSGNGGCSSIAPDIAIWLMKNIQVIKADPRIESEVNVEILSDTPITLTRNKAISQARKFGADLVLMIDSDQKPDMELGRDPLAKPFWDSTFNFIYNHWDKGPSAVGAPYCGPPPIENVYVFRWANSQSETAEPNHRIDAYSREEAAQMSGIWPVAALPTGMILFDIRCFDLMEPPYFYYEYTDEFETEKASTEDVTATRDIALMGQMKLGYSPIYCNFDSWIGHWKPKCVPKPRMVEINEISEKYIDAVKRDRPTVRRLAYIRPPSRNGHAGQEPVAPGPVLGPNPQAGVGALK